MVETLVSKRLVTVGGEDGAPTIEIVHESLIEKWDRLRGWVNADRKSLELRSEIQRAADKWVENQFNPDFLYQCLPLDNALAWSENHPDDLARMESVGDFLNKSKILRRSDLEKERGRSRRFRAIAIVAGILAAISVGLWRLADAAREGPQRRKQQRRASC